MNNRIFIGVGAFLLIGVISNIVTVLIANDNIKASLNHQGYKIVNVDAIIVIPYAVKLVTESKGDNKVSVYHQSWDLCFYGFRIVTMWEKNGKDIDSGPVYI